MNQQSFIDIIYHQKVLCKLNYNSKQTTLNDLRNDIGNKYNIQPLLILFTINHIGVNDYKQLVNKFINKQNKIQISIEPIEAKISFCQLDNEGNAFDFTYDIIETLISSFKEKTFNFFKGKMDEFNYKISSYEFYTNDNEDKKYFEENKPFAYHFTNSKSNKFYFLIKNTSVSFYNSINNAKNDLIEYEKKTDKIVLRQDVSNGQAFSVVIQTYNHLMKEININPEMTIGELKEKIEEEFLVRKEYQELLYLVYKLKDDSKKIKDFSIRPQGIIFLRGFLFPLIFVDYYQKSNKNIVSINIAEKISFIKTEIIAKLGLETIYSYKLIFNGKELEDNSFLIDHNVQRMQMIYFK